MSEANSDFPTKCHASPRLKDDLRKSVERLFISTALLELKRASDIAHQLVMVVSSICRQLY